MFVVVVTITVFRVVHSPKKYVQVAEQILDSINNGHFPIGRRLPPERDLAASMGVSRQCIREALLGLELLGVLDIRIGQGTFVVSHLDTDRLGDLAESIPPFELLEARMVVESSIAGLVAQKQPASALERLELLTVGMEQILDDPERLGEFMQMGLEFHRVLAEASCNSVLTSVVSSFVTPSQNLLVTINRKVLEPRDSRLSQVCEHRMILDAIRAGDKRRAMEAMEMHLKHVGTLCSQEF